MKPVRCKFHGRSHDYSVCAKCGHQFCEMYWIGCPRCENGLRRYRKFDPADEDEMNYRATHKARKGY